MTASPNPIDFFISRAGVDSAFAEFTGRILEDAGYSVLLQQWDFQNTNFIAQMDRGLKSGARVIALLSPEYLASDYCLAECYSVLAPDPLNKRGQLISFRIKGCAPSGLLGALFYWDFTKIHDPNQLREQILNAVKMGRHKEGNWTPGNFWRPATSLLHPQVRATPSFTDRLGELASIAEAFAANRTPVLVGLPGGGKSSLARQYALQFKDEYAGIWWLLADKDGIGGWIFLEEGLADLATDLLPGIDKGTSRTKVARQALDFLAHRDFERPWLLIYDNVDDPAIFRTWNPGGSTRILATSWLQGWDSSFRPIPVREWEPDDAASFLFAASGRIDIGAADAKLLSDQLGNLPLSLSHAAAYLKTRHNIDVSSYLKNLVRHMKEVPVDAEYDKAVFATFAEAIEVAEQLAPGARAVSSLAAFFASDEIPIELLNLDVDYPAEHKATSGQIEDAIGALNHLSMFNLSSDRKSVSVHRLVQAAQRDTLDSARTKWASTAVQVLNRAFRGETGDPQYGAAMLPHAQSVIAHAQDDVGRPLAELLRKTARLLGNRGFHLHALPLLQRYTRIANSLGARDQAEAWQARLEISTCLRVLGRFSEAEQLAEQICARMRQTLTPDRFLFAAALDELGLIFMAQHKYGSAIAAARLALNMRRNELGDKSEHVADTLNNLGQIYSYRGRFGRARSYHQRALHIRERLQPQNKWAISNSINNLAQIDFRNGKMIDALEGYKRALHIRRETAGLAQPLIANALDNVASAYQWLGQFAEAEPLHREALQIYETFYGRSHQDVAITLLNIARCEVFGGRHKEAEATLTRASEIIREKFDETSQHYAALCHGWADLFLHTGHTQEAESMCRKAISVYQLHFPSTDQLFAQLRAMLKILEGSALC